MNQATSSKPRTLPPSFRRYIRFEDEWPLFSLTVVPHEASQTAWAYLSGLPDLTARPDGWMHLFHEWKRLERWCYHDGIRGWYCICQRENVRFTRWLTAIGAEPVTEIVGRGVQYQKRLLTDPSAMWSQLNMRHVAAFIRQGRVGHA